LFVPVGFMAVLLMAARWWGWAVVLAAAVTIGVEFTQTVFLPERTGSVGDVITNTCGAVLGASFARVRRWRRQREPPRVHDGLSHISGRGGRARLAPGVCRTRVADAPLGRRAAMLAEGSCSYLGCANTPSDARASTSSEECKLARVG
jgi:hypothetical protein